MQEKNSQIPIPATPQTSTRVQKCAYAHENSLGCLFILLTLVLCAFIFLLFLLSILELKRPKDSGPCKNVETTLKWIGVLGGTANLVQTFITDF